MEEAQRTSYCGVVPCTPSLVRQLYINLIEIYFINLLLSSLKYLEINFGRVGGKSQNARWPPQTIEFHHPRQQRKTEAACPGSFGAGTNGEERKIDHVFRLAFFDRKELNTKWEGVEKPPHFSPAIFL